MAWYKLYIKTGDNEPICCGLFEFETEEEAKEEAFQYAISNHEALEGSCWVEETSGPDDIDEDYQ